MFDALSDALPYIHAAATWFMVGLIWFVQVVHYPLMGKVSTQAFAAYEIAHQRQTTWVVLPPMITELATAILLLFSHEAMQSNSLLLWIGLALLTLIWLSTFALQVPQHKRLERGFDSASWQRLIRSNWVRTVLWTIRGFIALRLL